MKICELWENKTLYQIVKISDIGIEYGEEFVSYEIIYDSNKKFIGITSSDSRVGFIKRFIKLRGNTYITKR
jgi:hypothetical protein